MPPVPCIAVLELVFGPCTHAHHSSRQLSQTPGVHGRSGSTIEEEEQNRSLDACMDDGWMWNTYARKLSSQKESGAAQLCSRGVIRSLKQAIGSISFDYYTIYIRYDDHDDRIGRESDIIISSHQVKQMGRKTDDEQTQLPREPCVLESPHQASSAFLK